MEFNSTAARMLLDYVRILAERNEYGPGEGFEYKLFDDVGSDEPSPLITSEERANLRFLAGKTGLWVTYNLESRKFELINALEWIKLRTHE